MSIRVEDILYPPPTPDPTIDYDMDSGIDYTDTTIRTKEISPYPNYAEGLVGAKSTRSYSTPKALAELQARKASGAFNKPRITIEDTDSNTYQVYSGGDHRREIREKDQREVLRKRREESLKYEKDARHAGKNPSITIEDTDTNTYNVYNSRLHRHEIQTLGQRKKRTDPIQQKHARHAKKHYEAKAKFDKRFDLLAPTRHEAQIEVKRPKQKKEIREHSLRQINPETNEPYPRQPPISKEEMDALDLTKFARGHFKTFNPRHIHHARVGMGDTERSLGEKDDQYFGHNLVQYPTTTTGGEAWVRRGGRLEHSNPMIGQLLNEETIVGETIDRGDDPISKPRTWEGKDRMGMSRPDKLREKPNTLTKMLKKKPVGRSVLMDADAIAKVGTDITYENKVIPTLKGEAMLETAYSTRQQPSYKYDPKSSLKISNVFRGFADDAVMENTRSEFYFYNEEGKKEYRALGEEPQPGDILPTIYATDSYREGAIDTGMGGRELGAYLSAPPYDELEKPEAKPRLPQAEIDAYTTRPDSKLRLRSHYGESGMSEIKSVKQAGGKEGRIVVNKSTIQGSDRLPYGMKEPRTYGDLEGKSVMIPKQKDEPLHFRVKGKDFDYDTKGYERERREMVEELVGEQKQETLLLEPEDLGMTEGVKYDPNWDTQERGVVRGSLANKKLFKDKDLKALAMTKGIAVEKREVGGDKGRGGRYDTFRGNKGKSAKGQKGVVKGGIMRTKWEVIDGVGREVFYRPTSQNPTAVMEKIIPAPKYRRAQAPRELLLEKLRIGNPDAFTLDDDYQPSGEAPQYEENFLSSEFVDSEDDLTDDDGDYAIAQYD